MTNDRPSRIALRALLFAALGTTLATWAPTTNHVRAVKLLQRFGTDERAAPSTLREEPVLVPRAGADPVNARLYVAREGHGLPGVVLVPGVHHLGIDEPRLVRFARAMAESGVAVLTPEVRELLDYRVDAASTDAIGAAATWLHARTKRTVGLMGMSFAGGLALLAAADARFAPHVGFVVAVGAHDDLARVARFFATNAIARPDGSVLAMRAHEYGPLVLVYDRLEDFFAPADVPAVRESLRAWLWEDRDRARALLPAVPEPARARLSALYEGKIDTIAPELLAEVDRRAGAMGAASPHGHVAALHTPVFLLHGAGDSVIPASETLWLARDVPAGLVRDVLVSPAVVHVELEGEPTIADRWRLVHFMAEILAQADAGRRAAP